MEGKIMNLKGVVWKAVGWIHMVQNREKG